MTIHKLLEERKTGVLDFGGARMALLDIEAGFWGMRRQIEGLIGERLTNSVLQQAGANGGASFARSFAGQAKIEKSAVFSACIEAYQTAGFGRFDIERLEWPLGRVIIRATHAFEAWMYQQHGLMPDAPICSYSAGVFVGFVNVLGDRQDVVCIEHSCQARGDAACLFELLPAAQAQGQPAVSFRPDPGLGRQLNLLETLFERMPMGIAVLDRDYNIQRYNPTWDDFSSLYAPASGVPLAPGVCYFDHLPGTEATIQPLFDRALAGETVRRNNIRLESGGIVTYWDIVLAPLVEGDEIGGILTVSIDVTERAGLRQNLEERVTAERNRLARELHDAVTQTLFSASLIADVLPRIWERDMEQGKQRLEELRELTRGALAEMRTLLLELRPAALAESNLAELLRQLTQAIGGRSRLPIALMIEGERPLPPEIQVALYRIAQEALNNIYKHAGADQVTIHLSYPGQAVRLSIEDDGRGFDPVDLKPQTLGLGIMRERAQKIGAALTVESQIGEGTAVTVHCPIANEKEANNE